MHSRCFFMRKKCVCGWGSTPDTGGGGYGSPPDVLSGGEGSHAPLGTPTSLSAFSLHPAKQSFLLRLSQLCDRRVGVHLRLLAFEPAVSCKHSSVIWAVSHTSPIYCRYLPGKKTSTTLCCLGIIAEPIVSSERQG